MSTPGTTAEFSPEPPLFSSTPSVADDEAIGRSALRKASLRLLPLIGIGYGIAYMDRVNVSFAALQMNHSLGFSASAYGLGAGLFFLSYALCEVPSNLLLVRFGARRWLSRIMLTWGLISIAMMLVRTPAQFYLARLALGAAEAGFFPGAIFYISQWFPAAKRSQAISRFYIALPLSSVVSGGIAGMLLGLQGHFGLAGWQWLFLAEGVPAILLSAAFLFCLPDSPAKAAWLSDAERIWIVQQLQSEDRAIGVGHGGSDVLRAFREPRVWLLGACFFCLYVCHYGLSFTAPLIVQKATSLSVTRVGFIIALFGVLGAISMLLSGWLSDRHNERYLHAMVPALAIAVCFLAAGSSGHPAIIVPAFALIFMFLMAWQPPGWALPSGFLSGKSAAAGIAGINTIAMCGGFVGPWWLGVAADHLGGYQHGLLGLAIPALLAGGIILWVRRISGRQAPVKLTASSA